MQPYNNLWLEIRNLSQYLLRFWWFIIIIKHSATIYKALKKLRCDKKIINLKYTTLILTAFYIYSNRIMPSPRSGPSSYSKRCTQQLSGAWLVDCTDTYRAESVVTCYEIVFITFRIESLYAYFKTISYAFIWLGLFAGYLVEWADICMRSLICSHGYYDLCILCYAVLVNLPLLLVKVAKYEKYISEINCNFKFVCL